MRLVEISDEDRTFLTLQGIRYEFTDDYNNIITGANIVGKSSHRRQLLINDIDILLSFLIIFLNQAFPDIDPDIIVTKDMYDKLLDIKIKL